MAKHRLKVGAVDAVQFLGDAEDLHRFDVRAERSPGGLMTARTRFGPVAMIAGDWLIRTPTGELCVLPDDGFRATYEPVDAHAEDAPPVPLGEEVPNDYTD